MSRLEAQTALSRILLEKVRNDKYPSGTQMTILEQNLPPSLEREYFAVLLEKVAADGTPSIPMLARMQQFAQRLL